MLSKTFHPDDYDDLTQGLRDINHAICRTRGAGIHVNIPHEHRLWEYASALQATRDHPTKIKTTLDVGCGHSALSAALSYQAPLVRECLEIDPEDKVANERENIDEQLLTCNVRFEQKDLEDLEGTYDAVYCISVIEHIPKDEQDAAWAKLASLVNPGGLLFITTDCCEDWDTPNHPNSNPSDREEFYTPEDIEARMVGLTDQDFLFSLDTKYNGNYVYDYTFFRLALSRG